MPLNEFQIDEKDIGDFDCDHVYDQWDLESHDGIIFCKWTCTKCRRVVYQLIGERYPPEKERDNAFAIMIPGTYQADDLKNK